MTVSATDSAIDVAYWFIQRGEKDNIFIDDDKLQHLLFAAQLAYAKKYKNSVLMPSLFIVNEKGFFEPNILKMFSLGRPYMPPVKINPKAAEFLEAVWKKYATTSASVMQNLIKASEAYLQNYKKDAYQLVNVSDIVNLFGRPSPAPLKDRPKMRISQNGPVMVSQWTPRKLSTPFRKGI